MSSAVGCLREVVVYTRGQSTGGSYDGWLFCIWGNTSGSSIFTTSVETIFSFRSWEIKPIVYKAVAYGTLKTFENYKQASSMRRGRLREVPFKVIFIGNFWYFEKWSLMRGGHKGRSDCSYSWLFSDVSTFFVCVYLFVFLSSLQLLSFD